MAEYASHANAYPDKAIGAATQNVSKPVTVNSALEDFDPVIGRLESLANSINGVADTLVGSVPEGVEKDQASPAPNSLIYAIQGRRNRLVRVVDHIERELRRIENGLS